MPWLEDDDHNKRLLKALQALAAEKGAIERLAGAINADERSHELDRARQGDQHKPGTKLVHATTIFRWIEGGFAKLSNAQAHKKRLIYEFLERAPEFKTALYKPEGRLPQGFLSFAAEHAELLAKPFDKDLSKLDGAFEVFRPSVASAQRKDRVVISKLMIETKNGFTRYREQQHHTDDAMHGALVDEKDEGAVIYSASQIIFLGFGTNGERFRLYAANDWFGQLIDPNPVTSFSGAFMGISGRKETAALPFVAVRARQAFDEIETAHLPLTDRRIPQDIRAALKGEAPSSGAGLLPTLAQKWLLG